jgi:hypothetical protein
MKLLDSKTEAYIKHLEIKNKALKAQMQQNSRFIQQLKDRIYILEHRHPFKTFIVKLFYERT